MFEGTLIRETASAYLIDVDDEQTWLPKSVVTYMRRDPADSKGLVKVAFKLEGWKARQLGWD